MGWRAFLAPDLASAPGLGDLAGWGVRATGRVPPKMPTPATFEPPQGYGYGP